MKSNSSVFIDLLTLCAIFLVPFASGHSLKYNPNMATMDEDDVFANASAIEMIRQKAEHELKFAASQIINPDAPTELPPKYDPYSSWYWRYKRDTQEKLTKRTMLKPNDLPRRQLKRSIYTDFEYSDLQVKSEMVYKAKELKILKMRNAEPNCANQSASIYRQYILLGFALGLVIVTAFLVIKWISLFVNSNSGKILLQKNNTEAQMDSFSKTLLVTVQTAPRAV